MTNRLKPLPFKSEDEYEKEWRKKVGKSDTSHDAVSWDDLDASIKAHQRPSDSFCSKDIQVRYHLDRNQAAYTLRRWEGEGKIKRIGRFGISTYYQLVK